MVHELSTILKVMFIIIYGKIKCTLFMQLLQPQKSSAFIGEIYFFDCNPQSWLEHKQGYK